MPIKKLPDCIIARISAGEVIVSPYNALKELLENSMDACATRVSVLLSSTLLSLSVLDNGPGVSKEDLEIMCNNHYTSKVTALEDIRSCGTISGLGTFGFRGEALHSIGVSGRLFITARRQCDSFGYRASYSGAELMELRKVARDEPGLLVEVEDLFHHNDVRREHFYRNKSECMKCIEMIKSYGCIYSGISMTVDDKVVVPADDSPREIVFSEGGKGAKLSPVADGSGHVGAEGGAVPEYTQPGASEESCAPGIYSPVQETPDNSGRRASDNEKNTEAANNENIANKINYIARVFFENSSAVKDLEHRKAKNYLLICSNRSVALKKYRCIIFINRRLVKNDILRKRIFLKYRGLLKEGGNPFVYLEIGSDCVDVNVHPGKAEVLVGDEQVFEQIVQAVEEILSNDVHRLCNTVAEARPGAIPSDTGLPQMPLPISELSGLCSGSSAAPSQGPAVVQIVPLKEERAENMPISVPLTLEKQATSPSFMQQHEVSPLHSRNFAGSGMLPDAASPGYLSESEIKVYASSQVRTIEESVVKRRCPQKRFSLLSLSALQNEIRGIDTGFFRTLVYVGCTSTLLFAQSHTNLISIQRQAFLKEAFYIKLLKDFGNFEGRAIRPCRVEADSALAPMLLDYFGIRMENSCVVEAPVLFGVCAETWDSFSEVKTTEMETIRNVALAVAEVYKNTEINSKVFNQIKDDVVGTGGLIQCCRVLVALRDLYKKFGRC